MKRGGIGKDSLKLTISQMGALLIGMVSAMLLSRFRTLTEYGTYSQMYLIAEIVSPILLMGIPGSLTYFLPKARDELEKRRFLSQNLIVTTVLGFVTCGTLLLLKDFLVSYFTNPMLGSLIIVIALFPWAKSINNTAQHFLIVYNRTTWLISFRISHSATILLAVIATVSLELDFAVYMAMFIAVESAWAIFVYVMAYKVSGGLLPYFNSGLMKKILAYSIPIGLSGAIGSLNRHIDELIIGRFFSTEDLAIYANAARELPLKLVGISIAAALLPRLVLMISEKDIKGAVGLWRESIKLSYVFMCFFTTVLFVYAPEIITILYSAKYLPGVGVFRVYSVIMLLSLTSFNMIISAMGKTRFILYSTLASVGLNIVLSVILYKLLGFIGPAVATFISFTAYRLIQLRISVKLSGVEFKDMFPWKRMGILTLVNIFFGFVFALMRRVVPLDVHIGQIAESILFGTVWMVVYLGIYYRYVKGKWDILNEGRVD